MKTIRLLFFITTLALCSFRGMAAPSVPGFSTEGNDIWHHIIFSSGDAALSASINDNPLLTAPVSRSAEKQLWKLIGNADGFIIQQHDGRYIVCGDRLRLAADRALAASFRLVPSTVEQMPDSWEIEYTAAKDEFNRWNQWGGSGAGRQIGLYKAGEGGNALKFVSPQELPDVPALTEIEEFSVSPRESFTPDSRHTIWFTKPATAETVTDPWMEYGLPVGNGQFGAMTLGGIAQDHIQFNEKTLWSGSPSSRGAYQNFGDLYIEDISGTFGHSADKAVKDYVRGLDIDNGYAFASYSSPDGSVQHTRSYIASHPDGVVAIHLEASEPGSISVRLKLRNGVKLGMIPVRYADGTATFESSLDYVSFKACAKAVPEGGTMTTLADCIEITGADRLTVLIAGATDFDPAAPAYLGSRTAMADNVDTRISAAAAKGWDALLADHSADFHKYYDRVEFHIENAENSCHAQEMVTVYNKRRGGSRTTPSNLMLEEMYYALGRYLLISSSRGVDSPANLQGIWNNSNTPAWECDIHSNINVQMNYWPAEPTNLPEMHMPYLNYIYSMAMEHKEWQEYARRSGQTTGWTCFTQNNIFGHSDYAENYVIANAWYATHMWQHYAYTLDRDFLRDRAMPVMTSAARFWLERLTEDSDGTLVAPKEWSPEHGPAEEDGTAHAQQILCELFSEVLQGIDILGDEAGVDEAFTTELRDKFARLDKGLAKETYTGAFGNSPDGVQNGEEILREWKYTAYTAGQIEHRHQSHLMAMYPFASITPESEFFVPAVNSLKLRGFLSTGWSLAWRVALWARACDGTNAARIMKSVFRHAGAYDMNSGMGGVYYNLLDSHAPFQIDGNFGYTAAVTEMLVQTYGGTIRLLPALPAHWAAGHISGIRGEGNFEIDVKWKDNALTSATVLSGSGRDCILRYKGIADARVTDSKGNEVAAVADGTDCIKFATTAGETYTADLAGDTGLQDAVADSMHIRVENRTVRVDRPDASLLAFDIAGRLVASSSGSELHLDAVAPGTFIIKASCKGSASVKKVLIR